MVRNKELLETIEKYYLTGKKTLQEIADMNNLTLGACKNFLYRNKINKRKSFYEPRMQAIRDLYNLEGYTKDQLASIYHCSIQNISDILNKK